MRGFLASTAVLGVIAVGGVPTLGLVMTGEEKAPADQRTATAREDDREGPPPWARGGGAVGKQRGTPPGWARNHGGATPHGWAVREWAHCLADQAADREPGERVDPETACGGKPVSPGKAKKAPGATAQPPGQQGRVEPPGKTKKPDKAKKPEKTEKPKTG